MKEFCVVVNLNLFSMLIIQPSKKSFLRQKTIWPCENGVKKNMMEGV